MLYLKICIYQQMKFDLLSCMLELYMTYRENNQEGDSMLYITITDDEHFNDDSLSCALDYLRQPFPWKVYPSVANL
ncbi:hypothetical protein GCM10011346_51360 [Oceanobacillus neutriphilus]|uniref:Uncharacterized protein n=2 Tax=Oceanobacillus neutriphilus TaxID=531815 RepID=A0ABQ2P316_9BACI|nr:hypothetical protein GCM10011346_51360 [Oceanobacillus neutriphilus]